MTAVDLVWVDGPNVVIDGRGYPLDRLEGVTAEERRPRFRPWFAALGLAVLSIPLLNALPGGASEPYAALPYVLIGVMIFAAIFRVTFGDGTYVLVVEVAGERKVALRSSDHQLIISVLADVRELLRSNHGPS